MRLVLVSDTHTLHENLTIPEGDVLIHAGDMSYRGTIPELQPFFQWFGSQSHKHKICIAGNHDWGFQNDYNLTRTLIPDNVIYLQDSGVSLQGINFWGSPWQPMFHNWAFNLRKGEEIKQKWNLIPNNTNVLITHGPPYGILDQVPRWHGVDENVGCEELLSRVKELPELKVHVYGHIHESYGQKQVGEVLFVNASVCDHTYKADKLRSPLVIDL